MAGAGTNLKHMLMAHTRAYNAIKAMPGEGGRRGPARRQVSGRG